MIRPALERAWRVMNWAGERRRAYRARTYVWYVNMKYLGEANRLITQISPSGGIDLTYSLNAQLKG